MKFSCLSFFIMFIMGCIFVVLFLSMGMNEHTKEDAFKIAIFFIGCFLGIIIEALFKE